MFVGAPEKLMNGAAAGRSVASDSAIGAHAAGRVRVDGKFLARGAERLRICGATYGPFAPTSGGGGGPGRRRVEISLFAVSAAPRQADPDGLDAYASFPSTEYLDLSFLDFVTFNVYLHDLETFRRYLFRLHHLIGDKPLILGEL